MFTLIKTRSNTAAFKVGDKVRIVSYNQDRDLLVPSWLDNLISSENAEIIDCFGYIENMSQDGVSCYLRLPGLGNAYFYFDELELYY